MSNHWLYDSLFLNTHQHGLFVRVTINYVTMIYLNDLLWVYYLRSFILKTFHRFHAKDK